MKVQQRLFDVRRRWKSSSNSTAILSVAAANVSKCARVRAPHTRTPIEDTNGRDRRAKARGAARTHALLEKGSPAGLRRKRLISITNERSERECVNG